MTVVHTYFYIVVDTQQGMLHLKIRTLARNLDKVHAFHHFMP
jgi:hypothetical protein